VINGLSFEVPQGQTFAILGRSGCGKSTCLNTIAGVLAPPGSVYSGSVEVGGKTIAARDLIPTEGFAYVLERPALLPWRRALDNVALGAELGGVSRRQARSEASQHLRSVGLQGRADAFPRELSQGMQQRVSLARMLAFGGEVRLMDDPFGSLDEGTRLSMLQLLTRLRSSRAITTILVTHSIAEAAVLADEILLLGGERGQVVASWKVEISHPRDPQPLLVSDRIFELQREIQSVFHAGALTAVTL